VIWAASDGQPLLPHHAALIAVGTKLGNVVDPFGNGYPVYGRGPRLLIVLLIFISGKFMAVTISGKFMAVTISGKFMAFGVPLIFI
jgi:hypothetical protein